MVIQDKLLKAREALKRYCWAVQGAESFFHHIESNLMISSTGFQGYKEEHRYIQQIFSTLVEGFQARLSEVGVCIPQQKCLSIPLTEQLHIEVLSHLLVQDAKLEAQAQLRLEVLQRLVILYKHTLLNFFFFLIKTWWPCPMIQIVAFIMLFYCCWHFLIKLENHFIVVLCGNG